jgi:hypothetical protein
LTGIDAGRGHLPVLLRLIETFVGHTPSWSESWRFVRSHPAALPAVYG